VGISSTCRWFWQEGRCFYPGAAFALALISTFAGMNRDDDPDSIKNHASLPCFSPLTPELVVSRSPE
jgi:hypothetical protein